MYVNYKLLPGEPQHRMARRTKEEALETRTRILDAAERVFYERGVARASLEDIAASAEVTRGAIYWHFKDKAELFDAMMQRVVMPAEDMLEHAGCCGESNPLEILRRSTVDVLMRTAKDVRMQRIFEIAYHKCEYVGDAAGVRDRHIASQRECLGTIEEGFRACAACGQLPKSVDPRVAAGQLPAGVNPRVAAVGAMSLVSGLIANYVLDPGAFPLKRHAQALVDIYFRGVASAPAGAPAARPRRAPSAR